LISKRGPDVRAAHSRVASLSDKTEVATLATFALVFNGFHRANPTIQRADLKRDQNGASYAACPLLICIRNNVDLRYMSRRR